MPGMTKLTGRINEQNARWYALVASCFALFMAILDNLVVNVALPTISKDLEATTTQLQWIVSAYILVFASLQITAGGLGDRLGRKRFFMAGIALFTATSVLAAFSQNVEMLILARALQGLGAAFILPLSLSIISEAFPPEERGKALGIWSAISVSGLALGPVVGGLLVQYASWHWIFLVNIPIGIVAFAVSSAVIRETRDTSGTVATDIPGTILVTGAIASLTWALIEAGNRGWGDSLIVGALALAAVLFVSFVLVELRTERPMVPMRFFRSSTFTGANIVAFAVSFLIAGIAFFGTLYLQNVHGFSPVRSGLALLPMVAVMMVASPISGMMVGRIGASKLLAAGMVVAGIGTLLFMRANVHGTYMDILPSYLVMGLGMSLIFAPMTTAVLNSVEAGKSGVASAVNGAIREIGNAFGVALLGTIMNRAYQNYFTSDAQVRALRDNPDAGPLKPVLDILGAGMSYGGRVIQDQTLFPGVPADVSSMLREVSSNAFMVGMDRAIVVSVAVILVAAVVAWKLISDEVVAAHPVSEHAAFPVDVEAVPIPESGD
ncbi:MAG: MFS transporter [Thermomicrobiales bacterium]|nr:MFS transporter [Thermomicrobiales bacterium]